MNSGNVHFARAQNSALSATKHRRQGFDDTRIADTAVEFRTGGVPRLVMGAAFKAVVVENLGQAGSIPVRLRQYRQRFAPVQVHDARWRVT